MDRLSGMSLSADACQTGGIAFAYSTIMYNSLVTRTVLYTTVLGPFFASVILMEVG